MSSRSTNNKRSQGTRGRGRGRGRGGRNRRNFKKEKPVSAPKYEGPLVGSAAYHALHNQITPHNFDEATPVPREFIPTAFKLTNNNDARLLDLQQQMMDNGWRLNCDEEDNHYFTHPTYNGEYFDVYKRELSNGRPVYLPIVARDNDPKGLGCTFVMTSGQGGHIETNDWKSYWDNRAGRRRANYLDYLDRRQEKRRMYVEMAKTDPSVKVWNKDTPRCDPRTWNFNSPILTKQEVY